MPFADTVVNYNRKSDIKKTQYMQLGQGAHTIRILQPQAKTLPQHFFKGRGSVLCLEEECPICANNRNLWAQFDKEAKKQNGYNAKSYRFFVNVLDKTPAKVCADCGKEYKFLGTAFCSCGKPLPDAQPLNKVKVLSKGITLRDDLDSIDRAIQDAQGNPIGLTNFDITLMVSGTGTDTKVTPVPRTDSNQPVEVTEELYDLDKVVIKLSPEEMLEMLRGVTLKDIFAARKAQQDKFDPETFEPIASKEDLDSVSAEVKALFPESE